MTTANPSLHARLLAAVLGLSTLFATPSRAAEFFIPDSSDALLGLIVAQLTQSSTTLATLVANAKSSLETANLTLDSMRKATGVVEDLAYLTTSPDSLFDASQRSFSATFPELQAIEADVEDIRRNGFGLRGGDARGLLELLVRASSSRLGAYQAVMAYDAGTYGLLKPYMQRVDALNEVGTQTDLIAHKAAGELTPQTAAVLSARAEALSAQTAVAIAQSSLEVARIEEQRYVAERAKQARAQLEEQKELERLPALMPDGELDPLDLETAAGTHTTKKDGLQ